MLMVLEPPAPEQPPTDRRQRKVCLSAFSDSEGGTHVIAKGASAAFPLCLLSMELSAQLEARGATLEAEWAPRTVNEEADALTNGDTTGFNLCKRVNVEIESLPLLVLPRLQEEAARYYDELAEAKRQRREHPPPDPKGGRNGKKLKTTDPW